MVREIIALVVHSQFGTGQAQQFVDARRFPRFQLAADVWIYPRNSPAVRGQTVDISESGISAILKTEIRIGEVVRLEFNVPLGNVEVHALVRQRNAFRYGFQFLECSSAQDTIGRTCRMLAVELANKESASK